jgi:phage tail protein X
MRTLAVMSRRSISKLNAANRITDKHERAYAELVKLFATPKLSQDTVNAKSSRILGRIPSATADAIMEAGPGLRGRLWPQFLWEGICELRAR